MISDIDASLTNPGCVLAVVLVAIAAFVLAVPCWAWYSAGVQAKVYKRQGIELTQWEVFVGAKPAEQVIRVKEPAR